MTHVGVLLVIHARWSCHFQTFFLLVGAHLRDARSEAQAYSLRWLTCFGRYVTYAGGCLGGDHGVTTLPFRDVIS